MKEIQPYLIFDGDCREAMTFYAKCIGAELQTSTFGEADPKTPPEGKDRLIHARLAKNATVLMASDSGPGMPVRKGDNVWLSFSCESDAEVESLFKSLGAAGKTTMAPHDAFWGARFAMLADRFGINWMLNHERPKKA